MAGHTPGPWRVQERGDGTLDVVIDHDQLLPLPGTQGAMSYSRTVCSFEWRTLEHDANAALIAAAPDLLEALRETDRRLRHYRSVIARWKQQAQPETDDLDVEEVGHLDDELNDLDAQIDANRAALAKAEGR